MIERTAEEMTTDDAMQKAIWKWQSRFLFRRQAPQEILKPNDDQMGEDDGEGQFQDQEGNTLQRVEKPKGEDSDSDESEQSEEEEKSEDSEDSAMKEDKESGDGESAGDFKKLKLSTKHAAFLRKRDGEGWFLHYATQNDRTQQAVERQKLAVDENYVPTIEKIISTYPEYCDFEDLPWCEEDNEGLGKFLADLAEL